MENDDMYFEYLVSIGAMRPEEAQMARKQAQVDAMRDRSMTSPEGQMVGKHYVAPSFTQYAGQLMNAYGARKGQEKLEQQYGDFNARQEAMLRALRKPKSVMANPMEDEEEDDFMGIRSMYRP
jgi:hypothetical protein